MNTALTARVNLNGHLCIVPLSEFADQENLAQTLDSDYI